MDDFLKEALDIVKAQASVRVMDEEEIIAMVKRLSSGIKGASGGDAGAEDQVGIRASRSRKSPSLVLNAARRLKSLPASIWPGMGLTRHSTGKSGP